MRQESYHAPLPRRFVWLKRDYPYQMRVLTSIAHYGGVHMSIIMSAHTAEGQYALLIHYYKVAGVITHSPTSHNYRKLTVDEKEKIVRLRMQGVSMLQIANELGRYVSTVFYFLRRYER